MAGTHSGVGKTTVATGVMAALRRRGTQVGAAKVGPDFIDPGYHRLATGHPSRNLDTFLNPPDLLASLAARACLGRDILVIEGVMGLFDGAYEQTAGDMATPARLALASTASVAVLTKTPVVLVVDASAINQSVAALVHGFATWSAEVPVHGVILNRVGSDAHEDSLRRALADLPVLGALRRDPAFAWRDRHLGLVPVAERPNEILAALQTLAGAVERSVDLDALARLAAAAPQMEAPPLPPARSSYRLRDPRDTTLGAVGGGHDHRPRIAVAAGRAFTFVYPETLERLEEAGAELLPIDPAGDDGLPAEVDGLYAGGGFPEVYGEQLASNRAMLEQVADAAGDGLPIWAECGGLLWLARALDDRPLCGVVPATATMTSKLTLGYRTARVRSDNPVAPAGKRLRGHEFHYSRLEPAGDALELSNHRESWQEGHASKSMLATYLHLHLGADPAPAERFVRAAAIWHRDRTRRHAVG
ncbi:MAG: cobyrinate a,c-diamide synthase [Acidimicrobiales bacterium]